MRQINLNRQLLGLEDILFGTGTVTQTRGGQLATVTKINAGNMPFDETQTLLEWAQSVNLEQLGSIVTELQALYNNLNNINLVVDNLDSIAEKLNITDYTAASVLTRLLTVDGTDSGIDADLLDGQEGAYYLNASNINTGTINDSYLPDTITSDITGNAATSTKLETARTITLTGDVAGNINFDGSTNVTITTTVQPNSIALGTDTTGNYVAGVTAGTGIAVTGTAGEGWSPTVALSTVGTAGTYRSVTTDAYGRVKAGTNPTTVAGYGITDVYTKTEIDTNIGMVADFEATLN